MSKLLWYIRLYVTQLHPSRCSSNRVSIIVTSKPGLHMRDSAHESLCLQILIDSVLLFYVCIKIQISFWFPALQAN